MMGRIYSVRVSVVVNGVGKVMGKVVYVLEKRLDFILKVVRYY